MGAGEKYMDRLRAGKNIVAKTNLDDLDEESAKKILKNPGNADSKKMNSAEYLKFLYELGKKQGPFILSRVKR